MKKIYDIMREWKKESGYNKVIQFKYSHSTGVLNIYTSFPGILIGKAGQFSIKYTELFKKKMLTFKSINFIETDIYIV